MISKSPAKMSVCVIGSPDFSRRVSSTISHEFPACTLLFGSYLEAWPLLLSHRPQVLIWEIGFQYSERLHGNSRKLFANLRERFGEELYTIAALTSPERLFFGGDLLFAEELENTPSGFIDSFIASPPGLIPTVPTLKEQVVHALELCWEELKRRAQSKMALPALGSSGWVQSLADPRSRELWMRWLPRYASYTNENPIIVGQTGTGKTNLAFALHALSGRKGKFVSITPRDFSSSELVQAELFGAVEGAYTGAVEKWGLVKSAEKGTLFIDELQSIDKDLQGKLITFIENKTYRRVGSAESISADVRFVFASNRAMSDMMETQILRDDFAYRLERVQLELLPLAERRLDISAALAFALAKIRRQRPHTFPVLGLSPDAYRLLFSHRWPGNLRQLENSLAQLCELADMQQSPLINENYVNQLFESKLRGLGTTPQEIICQASLTLAKEAIVRSFTSLSRGCERLLELGREVALESCGGDTAKAAQLINEDSQVMRLLAETSVARRQTFGPPQSKGS